MTDYTTTLFDSDYEENEYMIEKQRNEQRAQTTYAVQPIIHWQSITPFVPDLGKRVLLTVGGVAREGYRVTEGQFRTMDGATHTDVRYWAEMPAGYSPDHVGR